MPLISNDGDDEARLNKAAAAGPPSFDDVEFDPHDPLTVKVHYDVSAWDFEQRAELSEVLAERAVPHIWDGAELIVPETIEGPVDQIFEELEQELGPFPVILAEAADSTEFGLDEWPQASLDRLQSSLIAAQVPHRWEKTKLVVAVAAEHEVDAMLDAIEADEQASVEPVAPEGSLNQLFRAGDRLERDSTHGDSRNIVLELVPKLSADAPPFGLAVGPWRTIVSHATMLYDQFDSGDAELDDIKAAAAQLKTACKSWV